MKEKNRITALLLCIFGFIFGLHHWYLGNWKKALLFTITAGGLYIWWIHDIIKLIFDKDYINNYKRCTSLKEDFKEEIRYQQKKAIIEQENRQYKASCQVCCPNCGSTQITANKKGFSLGKSIAGGIILTPIAGVATGMLGKNKIIITCLSCGKQFKPGR